MPPIVANILVIAVLAVVVFFSLRSVIRSRKHGGCGCECGSCSGCSGCSVHHQDDEK